MKFFDFIFTTKIGHFIFLMTFSILLIWIVSLFTTLSFPIMLLGSTLMSIFLVTIDGNKLI